MKYAFPVVYIRDKDGSYTAFAPDLPGMATCGRTLNEAAEMALDACTMWLRDAERKGEPIPKASELQDIDIDCDVGYICMVHVNT